MFRAVLLVLLIFSAILNANMCQDVYNKLGTDISRYKIRINAHIKEYNESCDIIYAYNLFLNQVEKMDELEKDNIYARNLGKLARLYPNIAYYIIDKNSFEYFNKLLNYKKKIIDKAIKKVFYKKNKKNLLYIRLALEFSNQNLKFKDFYKTLLNLKRDYNIEEIRTAYIFWYFYNEKYHISSKVNKKPYIKMYKNILNIYTIEQLERYLPYAKSFYYSLLPERYNNIDFIRIIKSLMDKINIKDLNKQAYFLKYSTIDIQIALADGNKPREIIQYFDMFIQYSFIMKFKQLKCYEKQSVAMLVTDNLSDKLNLKRYNQQIFIKISHKIEKSRTYKEIINILGMYNYAVQIFSYMTTPKQKEIFNYLMTVDIDNNIIKNLSLIYILNEYTTYLTAVVNQNQMYEEAKYKKIFEQSIDNTNILSMFRNNKYHQFINNINRLVGLPYEDIDSLTDDEKIQLIKKYAEYTDNAFDVLLYASGVGAVAIGAKVLIKATIKGVAKRVIKRAVKRQLYKVKRDMKEMFSQNNKKSMQKGRRNKNNKYQNDGDKIDGEDILSIITSTVERIYPKGCIEQKKLCTKDMQ
jgi:hypothetical protein